MLSMEEAYPNQKGNLTALVLAWLVLGPEHGRVDSRTHERFGDNVRAARHARGWTQEDLAHETGLATVQISRIERGVREIRLTTLLRLLTAFGVSSEELLEGLY